MSISELEREQFHKEGYFVRPGFIDAARVLELANEVDAFAGKEPPFDGRNLAQYEKLSALTVDPETLSIVDDLMGSDGYVFHHSHAAAHRAGLQGIAWHHDYEQVPQTNRSHLQIHVLHYLNGLDGTIGDLLLSPRSHRRVLRRDAMSMFGEDDLPGCVALDNLPQGSTVFAHSALVHARRAKPCGGARPRYFIDISYMQKGVLWPSYGREGWRDMLSSLNARVGHMKPGLFDSDAFFDIAEVSARMKGQAGSMALILPEAPREAYAVAGAIPIVQ